MTFKISWRVYRVLDASSSETIYIGCTMDPHTRRQAHAKSGPVYRWMRETGRKFELEVIDRFDDHQEALALEKHLILTTPGILNRSTRPGNIPIELRSNPKPWVLAGVSKATWYRKKRDLVQTKEGEA